MIMALPHCHSEIAADNLRQLESGDSLLQKTPLRGDKINRSWFASVGG
jgi:hypothetical protein